jgi:anti-anti-sigma factor
MPIARPARAYFGQVDHSFLLVLKGHVRYEAARALRSFIDDKLAEEADTFVIDLRELEAIDSTGLGLLAHLGWTTLVHGRRSVIVCAFQDVMTCLRSASFDTLFVLVDKWPFDEEARVVEVPLDCGDQMPPEVMGRLILDAHRDLAALSDENRQTFAAVISALETEVGQASLPSPHS